MSIKTGAFIALCTLIFAGLVPLSSAIAQTLPLTCDHTVPLNRWRTDANAENIQPGDVVCLEAGTRGNMRLENFAGTEENPIIITNYGGKTIIDTTSYGIKLANSKHVRLTGTGSPNHQYGIEASGILEVGELTSNVEVDHLEIHSASFAGMFVKTDPNCNPSTWRENFTMYDVSVHDNYVHHTGDGEGLYIGFTFYDGYTITCDGQETTVYGHIIDGLEVYNNIIEDTGAEGIQVSSVPNGAKIYNNIVTLYGQRPFANYQNNGVQISQGNTEIYNNIIQNGPGNGLIIFGTGHKVYNNIIDSAGAHGIFAHDRRAGLPHHYANNTIINPANDGIRIYNDQVTGANTIKNNIIVNPGDDYVVKLNNNVELDQSNNLFEADIATVKFNDWANDDYSLQADSPAVDMGADMGYLGITTDIVNTPRPQNSIYDIGAYEFKPSLVLQAQPANQALNLSWQVDVTLPLTSTWQLEYAPASGTFYPPITGLTNTLRSYALNGLTNYIPYTVTLKAMLNSTPILTAETVGMPTNRFIYLPLILSD